MSNNFPIDSSHHDIPSLIVEVEDHVIYIEQDPYDENPGHIAISPEMWFDLVEKLNDKLTQPRKG